MSKVYVHGRVGKGVGKGIYGAKTIEELKELISILTSPEWVEDTFIDETRFTGVFGVSNVDKYGILHDSTSKPPKEFVRVSSWGYCSIRRFVKMVLRSYEDNERVYYYVRRVDGRRGIVNYVKYTPIPVEEYVDAKLRFLETRGVREQGVLELYPKYLARRLYLELVHDVWAESNNVLFSEEYYYSIESALRFTPNKITVFIRRVKVLPGLEVTVGDVYKVVGYPEGYSIMYLGSMREDQVEKLVKYAEEHGVRVYEDYNDILVVKELPRELENLFNMIEEEGSNKES